MARPVPPPATWSRTTTPLQPLVESPSQLRGASVAALDLDVHVEERRRGVLPRIARPSWTTLVALLAVAALVFGAVKLIHSRSSPGVQGSSAVSDVAALIDQARRQATSGDVLGAVAKLEQRAESATGEDRVQLREEAASLLLNAAGAALQHGDPLGSLDFLSRAAALGDTQGSDQARLALPTARVTAARYLIDKDTATPQAADLLRQTIAEAPLSAAATSARDLLAAPAKVRGRLSIGGRPGAGVLVVLLLVSPSSTTDPQPSSTQPVATGLSDSSGAFDLGSAPPGSYILGFLDAASHFHRAAGRTALLTVLPAQLNRVTASISS